MEQGRKQLLFLNTFCKGTAAFPRGKPQTTKGNEEKTGLYIFLPKWLSEGRKYQISIKSEARLTGTVKCSSGTCSRDTNSWLQSPYGSAVMTRQKPRRRTAVVDPICHAWHSALVQRCSQDPAPDRNPSNRLLQGVPGWVQWWHCRDGARNSCVEHIEGCGRREKQRGNC